LAKLPGGAVITGGGAKLRGIADYAREILNMNAHVGKPPRFEGIIEQISDPSFATVVGLMLIDLDSAPSEGKRRSGGGLFGGLMSLFKKRSK